ncbi:MAG TPA: glycosyltransferase family 4 protein [Acidimicrobiales bacterium]|nr:glycosyltransferase family 4 protein [Acidimicrobiales bacterium]
MRLLFVVQRYGPEVFGGAEVFSREFATRMAGRGHAVDVVTSCAVSYVDWANVYEPGTSELDGVTVHRLPVDRPRDNELFNALNVRVNAGLRPTPLHLQRAWMDLQGPHVAELPSWLEEHAGEYDAAVFFTYLYWSTWAGLAAAGRRVPTVLHPTAHDEPPLYLAIYDLMFRLPDALGYLTPEEATLVGDRFRLRRPSVTTGVGIDLASEGSESRFRQRFGLGDAPYLLYIGRLDPHKGTEELFAFFEAYKARRPGSLKLVFMGEPIRPIEQHEDVVVTGFVDEQTKHDGLAGCLALMMPSYFESFSIVLLEAWVHRKPAIVQGRCDVLDGQVRRSGGGLPYRSFGEFEESVDLLLHDEGLAADLGRSGRRHAEEHYDWDIVLGRYERFLESVAQ